MAYSFEGQSSPQIDTKFDNKMSSDTLVPSKATKFMQFSFLHFNNNISLSNMHCVARNFLAIDCLSEYVSWHTMTCNVYRECKLNEPHNMRPTDRHLVYIPPTRCSRNYRLVGSRSSKMYLF